MSNQVPTVLTNAAQSFTDTQKAQGRANIDAASTTDVSSKISSVTADGVVVDATTTNNAVVISGHKVTVNNTTNTAAPAFGDDSAVRLPYQSNGYCTCLPGRMWLDKGTGTLPTWCQLHIQLHHPEFCISRT